MSRTDARMTDGRTTETTQTGATQSDAMQTDATQSDAAGGTAAERLGGPSERERMERAQNVDTTDETGARRQAGPDDQMRTDDRGSDAAAEQRATLIPPDRAESFNSRWTELKGQFVDEPQGAVRRANELVGEVLDELEELFRRQRADLEEGLDSEQTTTEDLRQALGRYRSFFDRLLSF